MAAFQSGAQRLMAGSDEVVRTGVSDASGFLVTSLFATTLGDRLIITSDGREVLLVGELAGIGDALLLAEHALEEPVACTVTANRTGLEGRRAAEGSRYVFVNDLEIVASVLPPFQFSLLVASLDTAFVPNPGGSSGNLCLGGAIGRFNTQIQLASSIGIARYDVDLTLIPQPSTVVAAAPGETLYFQVWHRDLNASGQTSNLTRAISVLMR